MARVVYALVLGGLIALALTGCGDDESTSAGNAAASGKESDASLPAATQETEQAKPRHGTVVGRAQAANTNGLILFNSKGFTLYHFHGDRGTASTCYGACAKKWPPLLTVGRPKAKAIYQRKLGTTKRKEGAVQVTYAGHPLYLFSGDGYTGDTSGNGLHSFGAKWSALHPSGNSAPRTGN